MRAGSNPPSVFTIFRFAAYLNQVQGPKGSVWLCSMWVRFSFLDWKSQVLPSLYSRLDFFLYCCQSSLIIHRRITFLYGGRSFLCLSSVSCSSSHYGIHIIDSISVLRFWNFSLLKYHKIAKSNQLQFQILP